MTPGHVRSEPSRASRMRVIPTTKAAVGFVLSALFGALVAVIVPGLLQSWISTLWLFEAIGVSLSLLSLLALVDARSEKHASERLAKRKDELSALLLEGQALNQRLAGTDEPLETLDPDIQAWADKTETWLTEHLGVSSVARFRNSAGIPMGVRDAS